MEDVVNKRIGNFSKKVDGIQTFLIFLLALLTPLFLGNLIQTIFGKGSALASNSQLIVGSIVNACLVLASFNLSGYKKILGVVTMPSLATILSGYLFGTASTIYMVWMIPAIWLGNFALVFSFKYFVLKENKNYFVASIIGIVSKVAIIFVGFLIINQLLNIPDKMYTVLMSAMSYVQLITASIGTLITYFIYKAEKNKIK